MRCILFDVPHHVFWSRNLIIDDSRERYLRVFKNSEEFTRGPRIGAGRR